MANLASDSSDGFTNSRLSACHRFIFVTKCKTVIVQYRTRVSFCVIHMLLPELNSRKRMHTSECQQKSQRMQYLIRQVWSLKRRYGYPSSDSHFLLLETSFCVQFFLYIIDFNKIGHLKKLKQSG